MDKVVGMGYVRSHLKQILENVGKGVRYIVTTRSKPKAALVSLEELETLEVMADRELMREILEAKEDIKAGRYTTLEEYLKEK
jgi:prevent-host-death family protein